MLHAIIFKENHRLIYTCGVDRIEIIANNFILSSVEFCSVCGESLK